MRADGDSLVIPVRALPVAFPGTFSNVTPALGDTVTLTAPTGLKFGPETFITFPGAAGDPVITGISADSTVLSFLPAPSTDTVASVAGLQPTYAVGVTLDTLQTTTKLTTPFVTDIPAVFSDATPAQNQLVTVSAPASSSCRRRGAVRRRYRSRFLGGCRQLVDDVRGQARRDGHPDPGALRGRA